MAAKITPKEFIRVLSKSGVMTNERFRETLTKLTEQGDASDAPAMADSLVADKSLTRWQADHLLEGK